MVNEAAAYRVIRRALTDRDFEQCILRDLTGTLAAEGISDSHELQEMSEILDQIIAGAQVLQQVNARIHDETAEYPQMLQDDIRKLRDQVDGTLAIASEMKHGLKRTLEQIDLAFKSTMIMYQVSFYLGVCLVVTAVLVALMSQNALLSAIFGGAGALDILAFFLMKPQGGLQSSRANLAQLQAAMYT